MTKADTVVVLLVLKAPSPPGMQSGHGGYRNTVAE